MTLLLVLVKESGPQLLHESVNRGMTGWMEFSQNKVAEGRRSNQKISGGCAAVWHKSDRMLLSLAGVLHTRCEHSRYSRCTFPSYAHMLYIWYVFAKLVQMTTSLHTLQTEALSILFFSEQFPSNVVRNGRFCLTMWCNSLVNWSTFASV